MCGRYFYDPKTGEIDEIWKIVKEVAKKQQKKVATGEVYPSNYVATIGANKEQKVVPGITKWGFEGWKKGQLMINARAETVEEKRSFAKPFLEMCCVFPMNGFYEWDKEKNMYLFTNHDAVLYVAGFFRIHQKAEGFETESIIITTEPNQAVAAVHDRMPLLIPKENVRDWILDLDFARNHIKQNMPELVRTPA